MAGTPERAAHAREAGAEAVIDRHGDVAAEVMAATGGVDRVVEVDLAANFATDVAVLRPNGVIASYSSTSDPRPVLPYYDLAAKGLTIRLVQGFALPPDAKRAGRAAIEDLAADGRLCIAVGLRLPLERVAETRERVEAGERGRQRRRRPIAAAPFPAWSGSALRPCGRRRRRGAPQRGRR